MKLSSHNQFKPTFATPRAQGLLPQLVTASPLSTPPAGHHSHVDRMGCEGACLTPSSAVGLPGAEHQSPQMGAPTRTTQIHLSHCCQPAVIYTPSAVPATCRQAEYQNNTMNIPYKTEVAPIKVGPSSPEAKQAAVDALDGEPPTGCLLGSQQCTPDSLTSCETGGSGTNDETWSFVPTPENSVDHKLFEEFLGGSGGSINDGPAFLRSEAGTFSRDGGCLVARKVGDSARIGLDMALDQSLCSQTFAGLAISTMFLHQLRSGDAGGSPPPDKILRDHVDLTPKQPGFTKALAVHRFLGIEDEFSSWWANTQKVHMLEPEADYFCVGTTDKAYDGVSDQLLLTDEVATEVAMTASTVRGHQMRQVYQIAGRAAIPGAWQWQVIPPSDVAQEARFNGLSLPASHGEAYYALPKCPDTVPDEPDPACVVMVGEGRPQGSQAASRLGRGLYLRSEVEDLLSMAMRVTGFRSDLMATAIRSQYLARYDEVGNKFTRCKVFRNCSGLANDADGLINLRPLARYLGIPNVATWFQSEVEALGLRQGVHYAVTQSIKASGRRERLVKLSNGVASHLCLRAPTSSGRWFRIYHMAVARILHPCDMLSYKEHCMRHAQRDKRLADQPVNPHHTARSV